MKRCRKISQRAEKDTGVSSSPNKKRAESAVVSLATAGSSGAVSVSLKRSSSVLAASEERTTNKRVTMEKAVTASPTMTPMTITTTAGGLSEDVYKNMDKTGRSEFLKYIKQQLKDANDPLFDSNQQFKVEISSAIYDLFWQTINGNVKKETTIVLLSEVVSLHEELPSIILDIVNILDAETSTTTETMPEKREVLAALLKNLDRVVPEKLIKERLEIDSLQEFGIVKQKMFYTKFIKIKTKLYYKQRRFNLFREESEGYAKLITELNVDFEEEATPASIMDIIKSLIGCFNLDPNRVLDIILESFESRPYLWQIFIPLIRAYMPTSSIICEVLGYKFRYFVDINRAPKSLYHVCALLLKYDVIELNDIYVWLSPTDRVIIADWEDSLKQAKEYVRKLNVIVTNKDKEPVEPDIEKEYTEEEYGANQKFGLCEALLKVGDWQNAYKIIRKLPEQCVLVHEPIARALCDLLHFSIKQVYSPHCFKALQNAKEKTHQRCKFNDDEKFMQKWQAKNFSDLRNNAFPMVSVLGPSLHLDSVLIFKLIRILRTILRDMGVNTQNTPTPYTEAETLYFEVMNILDAAILPALSYLNCNCPMAEEVMTVLKYFPYHFRYSLYARWKNETYLLHPKLIRKRGDAHKNIKALMKRVSKENVKPVGRQMGKLSHCSPAFLFDYILLQIQIYDNLIGPVVDSFKYLTTLSFDVLGYCLIEALAMADRNRIKHDGTSISMWLQSLASFCGAIFKKYNIELSGLLQFVANQLKMQKSLDLLILKDIVQKMAGVESAEELTNEQLNALCGGELLRGEAGYFSQVRNTKKSSQRLKEALANNNLAVTICLLMAQQKHCVIYKETTQSHLKLVGKLYDQCQDTLVQFGTFLGSTYSVDEYVDRLPSIITMLQEFHINADVAFFLARPMFSHQINQKYDQLRKADANSKKLTTAQKQIKYLDAINYVMNPIIESVRPLHGPKVWEDISPQFLVTFWSLSMYDLQVPAESYQKEILKLKQLSQQVIDSKDNTVSRNKKEQERFMALMEKLQDERKKQQEHVDKTMQRLEHQKDNWFLLRSAKSAKNETITQFLQLCLFPRCTFTALDALYCAKFVHTIHNLKANNFSTLLCYDRIFCDITYSVTSCTENEATRYGRFLCALLETVMRWHSDEATFNRECANYPGFVTKFRVSNQFSEANDNVGYENYRHVCHKWHYKITKAIVFCLDSKEYMQIRNALIILMRILPHYPVLIKLGQIIERKVEKVREEEKNKRPDLFVIASSYIGQLKIKSAQMLRESDFHQVADRLARTEAQTTFSPNTTTTANNITLTNANNTQNTTANLDSTNNNNNSNISDIAATTTARDSTPTQLTGSVSANQMQQQQSAVNESNQRNTNGDVKNDKREKERNEKPKVIKTTVSSSVADKEHHRGSTLTNNTAGPSSNNVSNHSTTRNIPLIEIRDDTNASEKERERERFSNTRSAKEFKKDERLRDRERERERYARNDDSADGNVSAPAATGSVAASRLKRERRREERFRAETPSVIEITDTNTVDKHYQEHYEAERARERDFSSVSNESGTSVQRTQEKLDFDKETKRRKVEQSSLLSKKLAAEEAGESTKKDRAGKIKERKDKMTDEEKETRKERKLGRKRERQEETSTIAEHKRKREVLNGDDDVRDRTDKYHTRESPHIRDIRERSHEKFDRSERVTRGADDRQYAAPKSTRSRINY